MIKAISIVLLSLITLAALLFGTLLTNNPWWIRSVAALGLVIYGAVGRSLFNILRPAQNSLRNSQILSRHAFETTALGMCIAGLDLKYIALNKAFCDIVGYSKEELLRMTHQDFAHPEDRQLDTPYIKELLAGNIESFNSVKRYLHKQGHVVWGQATVSLVRDEKGNPQYYVTQIQDITQLVQAQEKLTNMAQSDYLTGCLNRRAFMEKLTEEVARSKREKTSVSLILMDIDLFKSVNDGFGHLAGDHVLQQVSQCLHGNCRSYDFVGRYGGEEFILCLPNTDLREATSIAERLRKNIAALQIGFNDSNSIQVTSSLGVATLNYDSIEDVDFFIMRADNALYRAKTTRNAVCVA